MQNSTVTSVSTIFHTLCSNIEKICFQRGILLVFLTAFLFLNVGSAHAQGNRPMVADIVGGVTAEPGEYPWQAWFEFVINGDTYSCGASLIHPKWVLTAGHCIGTIDEVVLGAHRINNQSEANRQTIRVKNVFVHPNYNDNTLDNDIALLELTEAAQLNQWVATIPVVTSPADDSLYETGIESTVTGWGALQEGGSSPNALREVNLPIVSRETCRAVYGSELTQNMFCAGFADGGKDSCQGDSGGPLAVPDGNGGWKQAGVVSWGNGCAQANAYGVYTRLSRYEGWIAQHVNLSNPDPPPTPAPTVTPTVTPTEPPVETPVSTPEPTPTATPVPPVADIILNPDFEAGSNGDWRETSRQDYVLIYNELPEGISAQSGEYVAWLGGDDNEVSNLIQSIQLPNGDGISLNFAYQIQSTDNCRQDRAYVRINNKSIKRYKLCSSRETVDWVSESLSLDDYAGQRVTLRFHVYTNESNLSSFFVDDVNVTGGETTEVPVNIINGDLEAGANGDWREFSTVLGNGTGALISSHANTGTEGLVDGGDYVAWLGGFDNEVSRLRQNIQVPNSGTIYLTYDYEIVSDENRCNRDRARIIVDGKRLHQHNLCAKHSKGWQQQSLDLSEFTGQTVRLDFWTRTNGSSPSDFFVDNIQLTSTRSARSGAVSSHDFIFLPLIMTE